MKIQSKTIKAFIALAVITNATFSGVIASDKANAQVNCQCVQYVQKVIGKHIPIWHAKEADSKLSGLGYTRVNTPVQGAIVVMQPSFPGSHRVSGHIGFIDSYNPANGKIKVKGSNQGGSGSDAGCDNVNVVQFGTDVRGRSDISFWVKGNNNSQPSESGDIRQDAQYSILSKATGRALDAGGANGSQPYMHGSPNQSNDFHLWKLVKAGDYYLIISKATGKALDPGAANGNQIYMHESPNPNNDFHLWKLVKAGDYFQVISKATGKALDAGGANGNGVYPHENPNPNNDFHLWKLQG